MQNNFMLFSELQKQLSPSPIKSWRLLKQLRDGGRMRELDDFFMQDRKLYVNVPRFIVELESLGYANMKSDDFKNGDMKSSEIMELVKEMRLISDEITESRIQEEMKSDDFTAEIPKPNFVREDESVKSGQHNLKSDDFINPTNDRNVKSHDFIGIPREIIETKNELIDVLKGTVNSKEQDIQHLREVIADLSKQNQTLTQQNGWLTNLLVAPKPETDPIRRANVKVTDVTDEEFEEEAMHQDLGEEPDKQSEGTNRTASTDAGNTETQDQFVDAKPASHQENPSPEAEPEFTI